MKDPILRFKWLNQNTYGDLYSLRRNAMDCWYGNHPRNYMQMSKSHSVYEGDPGSEEDSIAFLSTSGHKYFYCYENLPTALAMKDVFSATSDNTRLFIVRVGGRSSKYNGKEGWQCMQVVDKIPMRDLPSDYIVDGLLLNRMNKKHNPDGNRPWHRWHCWNEVHDSWYGDSEISLPEAIEKEYNYLLKQASRI